MAVFTPNFLYTRHTCLPNYWMPHNQTINILIDDITLKRYRNTIQNHRRILARGCPSPSAKPRYKLLHIHTSCFSRMHDNVHPTTSTLHLIVTNFFTRRFWMFFNNKWELQHMIVLFLSDVIAEVFAGGIQKSYPSTNT